ncbi:unnamed protein product, partial [Rotaria sp. Silwood1]
KTVRQACRRLKEHGAPTNITTIEPSQNLRRSARIAENKKFQIYYGESDTSDYEEVNPEKTITSAIQRHITSTNHKMDWINWSILDRDNHPYRLLVKESLAITENSPSLNRTTRSIPLVSKKWNVTHNRKLESLRTEYNRTQEDPHISSIDPIKNYSKRKLTTKEHSALVNGLDYVYHNPSFNEKDFISNVETFFVTLLGRCTDKYDWEEKELDENITYNLTPEQLQYAAKLRSISDRFKRNAAKECNLKTKIHKESKLVLRELAQDKSIYITRPDKGKGIVILDHDEYVNKMLEILNDPLTFKTLDHDPTIKKENKLRGTLLKMKKRGFLSEAEYKQAFPVGSHCARIYGLPKIHKSGIPLRPVMSTIGSYNYRLAKLLANKLQPLRKRWFLLM